MEALNRRNHTSIIERDTCRNPCPSLGRGPGKHSCFAEFAEQSLPERNLAPLGAGGIQSKSPEPIPAERISNIARIGGTDSLDDLISKVTYATHGEPRKRKVTFYIPAPPFALDD